jgi:hypothetical protein
MLIDFLLTKRNLLNKKIIKLVLICFSIFFLRIEKSINRIENDETAHNLINYPFNFRCSRFNGYFKLNDLPPNRTILIRCNKKHLKKYSWVYGGVKDFPLKYFSIEMVTEDYKNSKYFVVIDLSIKNENNSLFNPLKSLQPNSDLLFLSFFYFKPKINLILTDFFNFGFLNFSNTLKIELNYSEKDTRNFMCFLRSISNLSSLSTGNYFYIPFKDCHYKMTLFLPFVVLIFLLNLNNETVNEKRKSRFSYKNLILSLSCLFNPNKSSLILFYFFINFRIGVIYSLISLICNINSF